jgi:hypothetical protein
VPPPGRRAHTGGTAEPVGKDDDVADVAWVIAVVAGVAAIVWGAEAFAEHLGPAAVALRVSTFALALLLAGAEREELATGVAASLRHAPAVAFGDVIGANVAMCLVALGVGAVVAPLPFGRLVRRYGLAGLPLGLVCAALAWAGMSAGPGVRFSSPCTSPTWPASGSSRVRHRRSVRSPS